MHGTNCAGRGARGRRSLLACAMAVVAIGAPAQASAAPEDLFVLMTLIDIYRAESQPNEEREAIDAALQRGGGRMGPVSGFVIPTLRAIGLFSDRIKDHFAEMVVANFRSESAGNLATAGADLPEDLEAWVNEGYEDL